MNIYNNIVPGSLHTYHYISLSKHVTHTVHGKYMDTVECLQEIFV